MSRFGPQAFLPLSLNELTCVTREGDFCMREKVFGIGISRTGTTSLTEALRTLGYKAVHCPLTLLTLKNRSLRLNEEIARRYDALTDTPVARMYRELDEAFPGSKFILTTRPVESWLGSVRRMRPSFALLALLPKVRQLARDMANTTSFSDERVLAQAYARHHRAVLDYFGVRLGKDLLVFDASTGDSWDKLCGFLGHERPAGPYPHYNRGYATTFTNMKDLLQHSLPLV
jgi:hypothetical protein